jgi:hypothetical protein
MPDGIPFITAFTWLLVALAIQTAVDAYFTRGILPRMPNRERALSWALVNAGVIFFLVLVIRLTFLPQELLLIAMRDHGIMSLGVMLVIVEYFVWAVLFVLGRGWLMRRWKGEAMSAEKRRAYWGYVWIGSVVTVFLNGFLYVAYTIVFPLMQGVEERFSG